MADLYKYGVAVHLYKPIIKRGVVDFAVSADWTPAAGDVKISKDGGAAANVTNLPTAITMGNTAMWDYSLTATEMQAAKIRISVADSATKAVEDTFFEIDTYGNASAQHAVDLSDGVRAGLTALPNANAEAAGGLYTRGSGAGQINQPANGMIDSNVVRWLGTAASTPTVAGVPNVNVKTWNDLVTVALPVVPTVAGRSLDVSAGGEAGVDWANVGSPTTSNGLTGTTISTSQVVASVTGAVGSVTGAVGSVTGAVGSVTGAVGSVTGNVGGNVVGSVASVTAAVAITSNIKKNQALTKFQFAMTDSTNHNPATGKTVTCTRSIDGGAQAAGTLANVTEISNGTYTVDFGAGDLNGNVIVLRATAASCDDTFERVVTQP
jgi:hypothetical protein